MHRIFLILITFFFVLDAYSGMGRSDTAVTIPMAYIQYGYQFPGADMAERFGGNSAIGGGFMVKSHKNWIFGVEYNYLFGSNTKDGLSILENLMTSEGNIISGDGTPSVVALFERGHLACAKFGKLFPVISKDLNSGFFITAGLGILTHKIKIDVENQSAPQLKGDYRRGYDRLTAGFQISQSVGYLYFGRSNIANFTIAFEIYEGFTRGQREYLFDSRQPGDGKRTDILFGPKVSWMIPFRKRGPQEFYYY